MFKKLKDKLTEEMKQSPARLQASMQQLAQAVVSPSLSNTSIQDLSSKDNFSLTDEADVTPKNSPAKHGFQTVDLTPPSENSRRSSISSNLSDASFLLPIYESPGSMYQLQSDMDQSASEIDDNINPQLEDVSKEQIHSAYRKALSKYNKYRGRFTDLVAYYREIEHTKTKLESLLVETQDKALRRISDLKEQCHLEQQAKAHLEDALRNDIEEKDHIIDSLKTKIKLLQDKSPKLEGVDTIKTFENTKDNDNIDVLVDLSNNEDIEKTTVDTKLFDENLQLKEKIQKMENFLEKYKDMLKRNKDKILDITNEKNSLEKDYEILQKSSQEKIDNVENELCKVKEEFSSLKKEIDILKKREEESVISLAENKLSIHRELEGKEEQIKQLTIELKQALELEKSLKKTLEFQNQELEKVKLIAKQNEEKSQEHLKSKAEALKQMQIEMQQKFNDFEEKMSTKYYEEVNKNKDLIIKIEELEKKVSTVPYESNTIYKLTQEIQELNGKKIKLQEQKEEYKRHLEEYKVQNEALKNELIEIKETFKQLKTNTETNDNIIKNTYNLEFNQLKQALAEKTEICEKSILKIQEYTEIIEQYKHKVVFQEEEINILRSKTCDEEQLYKLQDELENKNTEVLGLFSELKSCSTTISDLKKEINNLINHRNNFIKYLMKYKKTVKTLQQDYKSLKANINENIINGKHAIYGTINKTIKILPILNEENARLQIQINELKGKVDIETKLKEEWNKNFKKFEQIVSEKVILEKELTEKCNEVEEMKSKIKNINEFETNNNKLALENGKLHNKLNELELLYNDQEKLLKEIRIEKENVLKDLSLKNEQQKKTEHKLNIKIVDYENLTKEANDLSKKYADAINLVQILKSENQNQSSLIEEINVIKSDLASVQNNLDKKCNECENLSLKNTEQNEILKKLKSDYKNEKKIVEENNQKISELNNELKNSKELNQKLTIELQGIQKSLQNEFEVKTGLIQKLKTSKDELQKITEDKNTIKVELEQIKSKLKSIENKWNQSLNIKIVENEELTNYKSKLETEINELQIHKTNVDILKGEKADAIHELNELKLLHNLVRDENKNLKDNQNDLLTLNKALSQSQNEFVEKLGNLEKQNSDLINENRVFIKELEFCTYQLQNTGSELEQLKFQFRELEQVKNKNIELVQLLNESNNYEQKCINLANEIEYIAKINESLNSEIQDLRKEVINFQENEKKMRNTELELETHKSKILELENALSLSVQDLNNIRNDTKHETLKLKMELEEKDNQLKEMEFKNTKLSEKMEELSVLKLKTEEEIKQEVNNWREKTNKLEENVLNKQLELQQLSKKFLSIEEEINASNDVKLRNEDLIKNNENLLLEKRKLEAQLDEALVTYQAKEMKMHMLIEDCKNEATKLKEQLKMNEEEQSLRLKQIVKEFQAQLEDKEKELQGALKKRFDHQKYYETDIIQEYKEQLKDFQIELTKKSEEIEKLKEDDEKSRHENHKEVDSLLSKINEIKHEHLKEIQELDKKWNHITKQKTSQLKTKHENEITELRNEWLNERKNHENTQLLDKELENTTRVAMAAVQSNTGSFHTLQQTLISQKRELAELRKLVKLRQESVEDSTEIEYLRNILYKYMMGKETLVLAKVIAAVVKFDQEQTSTILKKEEDKLSLLGSLGLT